jgi:cell division transport system permease protein
MFIENLKRILKAGWKNFYRNISSSFATTFVLVVLLSLISFIFVFDNISEFLVRGIEEKADISVFLSEDFLEENILEFKKELEEKEIVKEVQYISPNEAYQNFIETHSEDEEIMSALVEVGGNPFLGSLSISAWEVTQYEEVVTYLEESEYSSLFDEVDYYQRKPVIDKIFSLTKLISNIGFISAILTILIVILLVFNTVRLAIFNSSEEIGVMRLVGASNLFIRGPFVIQGMLSGLFAVVVTNVFFLLTFWFFSPKLEVILGGFNVLNFFVSHLGIIFLIQLGTGMVLSLVASVLATRKYLKV